MSASIMSSLTKDFLYLVDGQSRNLLLTGHGSVTVASNTNMDEQTAKMLADVWNPTCNQPVRFSEIAPENLDRDMTCFEQDTIGGRGLVHWSGRRCGEQ